MSWALVADAVAADAACAVVLVDIDWLKVFNDAYGNADGDALIDRVEASLRTAAAAYGPKALCFRVGGDQFVAVVTGGQAHARAVLVAEAVRANIERAAIAVVHPTAITHGIATVSAVVVRAALAVDVRERLERLMARAKRAGRNCVIDDGDDDSEGGGDGAWVMVDVLTTRPSLVSLAPEVAARLVTVSDRLARRWCDVGLPHVVIGERAGALDLAGSPGMAPFAPLSAADADAAAQMDVAWAEGRSSGWRCGYYDELAVAAGVVAGAARSADRPLRCLFVGAGDAERFAVVTKAMAVVCEAAYVVEGCVRDEVLARSSLRRIGRASLEDRCNTGWFRRHG